MTMVVAGPVFPEWYWTPIFFLVLYSPLIAGGTVPLYLLARGRVRRRTIAVRAGLLAGALLASTALTTAAVALWRVVVG
jgi:hypothetical protein